MLSFNRRAFLTSAFLIFAGCGYSPTLAPGGSAEGLRGSIEIADPADASGFVLVRELETLLGDAESPQYRLEADIRLRDEGVGILPDQTITRYQVVGVVDYQLSGLASGEEVAKGRVSNFTSYSATSTTVATTAARRDARDRLMINLADQIVSDLVLTRPEWSQ
jgi:LPS-assembly lipoprotein